ncbi:MAG: hypothetical protein ACRDZ8_14270 [Acidimicrobiales bacterium]
MAVNTVGVNTVGKILAGLIWAAFGELALLVGTGVYLLFAFQPGPVAFGSGPNGVESTVRLVHHLGSYVLVITLATVTVLAALRRVPTRHRVASIVVGAGLSAVTLFVTFSGGLLPWDTLALETITVGPIAKGYGMIWHNQVNRVFIGGSSLAPSTVRLWLTVHVVLAILVATALVVGAVLLRSARAAFRSKSR